MTPEQDQVLTDKLKALGYPDFAVQPGEDDIAMLYIDHRLICGTLYALSMPDKQLKALIEETVQ